MGIRIFNRYRISAEASFARLQKKISAVLSFASFATPVKLHEALRELVQYKARRRKIEAIPLLLCKRTFLIPYLAMEDKNSTVRWNLCLGGRYRIRTYHLVNVNDAL